jgi:WD40 repeat protein
MPPEASVHSYYAFSLEGGCMAASIPITCVNAHNLKKAIDVRGPTNGEDIPHLLAASPDNRHIAIWWLSNKVSRATLAIIDYGGRVAKKLGQTADNVLGLKYDSSGRYLAYILMQDSGPVLYVWEVGAYRLVLKRPIDGYDAMHVHFVKSRERAEFSTERSEDQLVLTGYRGAEGGVQIQENLHALPKEVPVDIDVFDLCTVSADARVAVWTPWVVYWTEGSKEKSVQLWDLNGKVQLWSQSLGDVPCPGRDAMCFHPSGEFLAVGQEGWIDIRETVHGSLVKRLPVDRRWSPEWIRFSPDGTLLATTLYDSVILWDWEWGAPLFQLNGLNEPRSDFSSDGTRWIVAGLDEFQIWTTENEGPDEDSYDFVDDYDEDGRPCDDDDDPLAVLLR